jgi:hypothetical protein
MLQFAVDPGEKKIARHLSASLCRAHTFNVPGFAAPVNWTIGLGGNHLLERRTSDGSQANCAADETQELPHP